MERTIVHIVGGDSRTRAEQARIVFALGHHAEVYAELEEVWERPPPEGLILAVDRPESGGARDLMAALKEHGVWLPVVVTAASPQVGHVVSAIKAGALDYLELPLELSQFAQRLAAILPEAERQAARRRSELEAIILVSALSKREGEVLEALSAGQSNKEIARLLAISPRTVEIHRANMMSKLGANHPADAVRLWVAAQGDMADIAHAGPADAAASSGNIVEFARPLSRRIQRLRHLGQRQ